MPADATDATPASPRHRRLTIALRALQIALAITFAITGGAKVAGAPVTVAAFQIISVGQWFRVVTGLLELAGAALLLIPALAGLGASLLGVVMVGAVATHLLVLHTSPLPPALLLAGLVTVVLARRRDIGGLLSRMRR